MSWRTIKDQADINYLMEAFGYFHDSCLKEMKYTSGTYVDEELRMQPTNNSRTLHVIFQHQYNDPTAIELEFSELIELKLYPVNPYYTAEIIDATLMLNDSSVCWYDCGTLPEGELDQYKGTLIRAGMVRWRTADEYIGETDVFCRRGI